MITRTAVLFFIILLSTLFSASFASAWDVSYEGDVMPFAEELGTEKWHTPLHAGFQWSSSDGDVLHMVDSTDDEVFPLGIPAYCYREGSYVDETTAATMEARVKVVSVSPVGVTDYALGFGLSLESCYAAVGLWPDKIGIRRTGLEGESDPWMFHYADMTAYHTLRLALRSDLEPRCTVWMDGEPVLSGGAKGGNTRGVHFGSSLYDPSATSESYWDYVRYSKSYEPVPEPAAVMGLGMGLVPLAGALARRRRK